MNPPADTRIPKGTTVRRFLNWYLDGRGKIHGRWPLKTSFEPDSFVELHYQGSRLVGIREWLESEDNPIERILTHDGKGRLKKSERNGPHPDLKTRNEYEYDSAGKLRARQETHRDTKVVRFRTQSRVSAQGLICENVQCDGNGKLKSRMIYEHNPKGWLTKETHFEKDGETVTGWFTIEHDQEGHEIRRVWHGNDGGTKTTTLIEYGNDHDLPLSVTLRPADGEAMTTVLTYDPSGKKIGTELRDSKGKKLAEKRPNPMGGDIRRSYMKVPALRGDGNSSVINGGPTPREVCDALIVMGYEHFKDERYREALPLFQSAVKADPENVFVLNALGACCLELGAYEMAVRWYEQALTREPDHAQSLKGIEFARKGAGLN